jgi:hypothetical protein
MRKLTEYFKYILSSRYSFRSRKSYSFPNLTMILCRIRRHPYDAVWYNPSGLEPDMRCKNCREDIG